jgi:hypothetical protein
MTDQTASQNVLTKLTTKTMRCKPALAKVEERTVPMCRISGIARGIKPAVGTNGETVYGLTGNFRGTNIQTGEVFYSGVCYLPGGVHEMILDPLDDLLANESTKSGAALNFAFDIFARPSDNAAGYEYTAVNLAPASRADPFAEIDAMIDGKALPLLERPTLVAPPKKGV